MVNRQINTIIGGERVAKKNDEESNVSRAVTKTGGIRRLYVEMSRFAASDDSAAPFCGSRLFNFLFREPA